jgi:hypothetical protein
MSLSHWSEMASERKPLAKHTCGCSMNSKRPGANCEAAFHRIDAVICPKQLKRALCLSRELPYGVFRISLPISLAHE